MTEPRPRRRTGTLAPAKGLNGHASVNGRSVNGHVPGRRSKPRVADPRPDEREPDAWDRRVADALGFLRRRMTGQYDVDEFGFDPDLTSALIHPLCRLMYRRYFRVETTGIEHLPLDRGGSDRGQPLRHRPGGRAHALPGRARRDTTAPTPAPARSRPRVPAARGLRTGPQDRQHAGLQPRRRAADAQRRVRRRVPRGLQGHRQAVPRAVQAAALRPGRLRLSGPAHGYPDRPGRHRRGGGDLPDPGQREAAGPGDRTARTYR